MKMVRHQDIRVQRAAKALRDPGQAIEEEQVVVVSEEARLTIVPALNDMHGNTGNFEARAARHGVLGNSSSLHPNNARRLNR